MIAPALVGLVAVLLVVEGIRKFRRRSHTLLNPHKLPLPPGPNALPFLGSLLEINRKAPFLTYTEWAKTYGDIVYMRALHQEFLILGSEQVAVALLEKRSQKYSDRPSDPVSHLFGWGWSTTSARYGPRFRLHRRLLHQFFNAQAALAHRPRQLQKAYELTRHLLDNPTDYAKHLTTYSAALVMEVTYGCSSEESETFVTSMQRAADMVIHATTLPVIAMCTAFPFVKVLPAWLPGMGFKAHAEECRRLTVEAVNAPYEWVKQQLRKGVAAPSMVADAITRYDLDDDSKDPDLTLGVKESAGSLYSAAVETTYSTLLVFIYLMMNHPDVQRRAQAEIESLVGHNRLPDLGDRAALPYVDAIMREVIRWYPVVPIALPHATTEDDIYEGYYIPQGMMVIPNLWMMSRNEERYPNPEAFMPERFLDKNGKLNEDKVTWIFGFGRRICPGRHVAEVSLWSAMVCILALFRIEKTEGSDNVEWTTGVTSHPLPFPCKIVPKDEGIDGGKLSGLMDASCVGL